LLALARQLDDQLQAQLRKIGDDFRPGREYIAAWGYEIGPHGSVPYNTQDPRPQTPQRTPDAR
jgi:hypothetical protein